MKELDLLSVNFSFLLPLSIASMRFGYAEIEKDSMTSPLILELP